MSGETEADISGWTVDTVRAHFATMLDERDRRDGERYDALVQMIAEADRRYEERFVAQNKAMEVAFTASEKAVTAALTAQKEASSADLLAQKEAVGKAEIASEKRFESVNEFRASLSDAQARNISRTEVEQINKSFTEKIEDLRVRQSNTESLTLSNAAQVQGNAAGSQRAQTLVFGLIGATVAVGGVLLAVAK